jgi:hypothetical protein
LSPAGAITHIADIPAPPEEVFGRLLDRARAGEIDSSFEYWRPRDWPPMVGTLNDFKAKAGPISMKGISRFAEFDPPHCLVIESVKPSWPISIRMSWDLEQVGDGTRYAYRMEAHAAAGFGWAARRMLETYDRSLAEDVVALASLF